MPPDKERRRPAEAASETSRKTTVNAECTAPAKPIVWMRAVRDAPDRPSSAQVHVLVMLALRLRKTGEGFASQHQLAQDCGAHVRTVKRAIKWARAAGYLERTRRGHRIKDGTALASQYRLLDPVDNPTQSDTGVPLATEAKVTEPQAKVTEQRPKVTPGAYSEVFYPEVFTPEGGASRSAHAPPRPPPGGTFAEEHNQYLADLHAWCEDHRPPGDTRPPARLMAVAERMGHLDEPNDYARINAIGKREDEIAEDINHIAALRGPNPFDTNGRHPSEPHPLDVLFAEDIPDLATLGRRVAELCNDGHKIYPPEVFIVSRELFGSDADVGEDDGLEGPLWDSFFHHRQRQETA